MAGQQIMKMQAATAQSPRRVSSERLLCNSECRADWLVVHWELARWGLTSVYQFAGRLPTWFAPSTRDDILVAIGAPFVLANGRSSRWILQRAGHRVMLAPGQTRSGFGIRFAPGALRLRYPEGYGREPAIGMRIGRLQELLSSQADLAGFEILVRCRFGNPLADRNDGLDLLVEFEAIAGKGASPGDAARTLGVRPERLRRAAAMTGLTAVRFANLSRVRSGIDLLCSGMTCRDVASRLGYAHAAHFSREARSLLGFAPAAAARLVRTQTMHLRMTTPARYYALS